MESEHTDTAKATSQSTVNKADTALVSIQT